jgi:hypothetical protein
MQPNTSPMTVELNARDILQGITLILNNQMLQESHEYLAKCEKNPPPRWAAARHHGQLRGKPLGQGGRVSLRRQRHQEKLARQSTVAQQQYSLIKQGGLDSQKPILKARVLRYCI